MLHGAAAYGWWPPAGAAIAGADAVAESSRGLAEMILGCCHGSYPMAVSIQQRVAGNNTGAGANRGIGEAVALSWQHGAEVLLLGRDEASLTRVYDQIVDLGCPTPGIIHWISPRDNALRHAGR